MNLEHEGKNGRDSFLDQLSQMRLCSRGMDRRRSERKGALQDVWV